jgi:hypothetical protein
VPRYVILEHDHPVLHWDLMLEAGPALRTWRLAAPPLPGAGVAAEALGDHRASYLDHEGPVSGGRGRVRRWDHGEFSWLVDEPDVAEVALRGTRVAGVLLLRRCEGSGWTADFRDRPSGVC